MQGKSAADDGVFPQSSKLRESCDYWNYPHEPVIVFRTHWADDIAIATQHMEIIQSEPVLLNDLIILYAYFKSS